jgi:hypothetical protein
VPLGTGKFTFTDHETGTFSFRVDGVSDAKSIARLPFWVVLESDLTAMHRVHILRDHYWKCSRAALTSLYAPVSGDARRPASRWSMAMIPGAWKTLRR